MDRASTNTNGWWRWLAWGGAAALLFAPLVAMQVSDDVMWTPGDFAVFGALLLAVLCGFEVLLRQAANASYRLAAAMAIGTAFLLIWGTLAVGLIGSEDNPANLMVVAVLAVAIVGAVLARFAAQGMAKAMAVAAGAQLAVTGIALFGRVGEPVASADLRVALVFALLWSGSALLFARAARVS